MICGNHHDTDCSDVLERMFFFIDNELADADCGAIEQHLEECGPCLQKYDLERTVKALVQRSCAEHAPEGLRDRVLLRLQQVRVEITTVQQTQLPD
jgi:mycothiol system anti-sigma-R factor